MAKATKQVSTKTKPRKPSRKSKRGRAKEAALLASTSAVKRGPRPGNAKQRGANFLAMERTWIDQGKPDASDTEGAVFAAAFNLDILAARVPLTPASERAREIMPEITRLWAVHAGDEMEPGTGIIAAMRR
jgi:hypothetical protein